MTSTVLTLRRAGLDDFAVFFRLKSEPSDVFWSGHATPPDRDRLSAWYAEALGRRVIVLAETAGRMVGYAYLIPDGDLVETAVGVSQAETGRGLGRLIIAQVADLVDEIYPGRRVTAWICLRNLASVRAHEAAGYVRQPGLERRVALAADPSIDTQGCWARQPSTVRSGT